MTNYLRYKYSMIINKKSVFIASLFSPLLMLLYSNIYVFGEEKLLNRFSRPLAPELLLQSESDFREISSKVIKRFDNMFAAELNLFPESFNLQNFYSLDMGDSDMSLEDEFQDSNLMYIANSSLRYVGKKFNIYITTNILSPYSDRYKFVPYEGVQFETAFSVKKFSFPDGNEGVLFKDHSIKDAQNQVVFIKDKIYYVTIASNLPENEVINIAINHVIMK